MRHVSNNNNNNNYSMFNNNNNNSNINNNRSGDKRKGLQKNEYEEQKVDEFLSRADGNGRVYFNNLPEDNYLLKMGETNDFMPYSK